VGLTGLPDTHNGSLQANNPPVVLPEITISENGKFFPFTTRITVRAFDFENSPLTFEWYYQNTLLGSGVSSADGTTNATWKGNNTSVVLPRNVTKNYLDFTATETGTVVCVVKDGQGGVTSVSVQIYGKANPYPQSMVSVLPGVVLREISTPAQIRLSQNATANFSVLTAAMPGHTFGFLWVFHGSNNWTPPAAYSSGTTTILADGGVKNEVTRSLVNETVPNGISKVAVAKVHVTATNTSNSTSYSRVYEYPVTLLQNQPPKDISVAVKLNNSPVNVYAPIPLNSKLELSATATDPDNDLWWVLWKIIPPAPHPQFFVWGRKIILDTSPYAPGSTISGTVEVYDRLGAVNSAPLPALTLAST
jgi:hypothetical protein